MVAGNEGEQDIQLWAAGGIECWLLAAGGYLPPGIPPRPPRQLAGRPGWLEAVVLVCPADGGMSTPAPLQSVGLLFSATGFPPHLLSVGLERRGHDLRA
ncbi:uncharacterized [Lates japonicus]